MISLVKNNYFIILLFAVFIAHPAMTEHAEFALSYANLVEYSEFNTFFNLREHEISLQIIIPALLLKIGLTSGITQIIMTLLCTGIILLAEVIVIYYFLNKNNINKNNIYITVIFLVMLVLLIRPKNNTLYPWSPAIYFFEFGNAGLWMTLLACGYYITDQIKKYKFISIVLLLWHPVWGAANILFFIAVNNEIIFFKKYIYVLLIILLSFIFSSLFIDINYDLLFQIKKINDTVFTAHNPVLSKDFIGLLNYIFYNIAPIFLFFFVSKKNKNNLGKVYLLIFYYLILTATLLIYLEFSRYIALPYSQIIYRGIPNRYLNIIHVIITIWAICYIYSNLNLLNLKENWLNIIFCFLTLFMILGTKSSLLIFGVFICVFLVNFKKNYLFILSTVLYIIFFYRNYSNTPYNVLTEYVSNKPIINFLKDNKDKGGYILSSRVQSFKGLNVGTISNSQYYVPMLTVVNDIDIYCSKITVYNFNDMNDVADSCFRDRTASEWRIIAKSLNAKFIITNENVILDLDLKLNSDGFNIYEIN